jgi:hypothetical protein
MASAAFVLTTFDTHRPEGQWQPKAAQGSNILRWLAFPCFLRNTGQLLLLKKLIVDHFLRVHHEDA